MSQIGRNRNKAKKTDTEIIFLVEESLEGGYDARALGHSIFTQAETLSQLREALKDAVRCHFNKKERPRLIRLHLIKDCPATIPTF